MAWGDLPASIRGSRRQRGRRKDEVAGPYRSQSSVPKIRKAATKQEHRSVAPSAPKTLSSALRGPSTNPLALGPHTSGPAVPGTGPALPSLLGLSKEQSDTLQQQGVKASSLKAMLKGIEDERHAPSTVETLAIAAMLSPIGPEALIAKLGASGLERLIPAAAKAIRASEEAAAQGGAAAARTGARGAARRAIAKAEPRAVATARQAATRRAAQALERAPAPVRVGAKVAGRAITAPVKHPFTAPLAIQTPAALTHGDPGQFVKALEGQGTLADIGGSLGGAVSQVVPGEVAQNVVKDAFNLPAQALPSVYLPLAGAVEASQGDPSRLQGLLEEYSRSGFLPAVFRGDSGAALHALETHPLYSALEASGAAAVAGRGAGAVVRGATRGRVGGTARPDLRIEHYPNVRETGRRYSPDLLRQLAQRGGERLRGRGGRDPFLAGEGKTKKLIRERTDRFVFEREQVRRGHRTRAVRAAEAAMPKDRASAAVVALAVQRIVRHPSTFNEDLRSYRTMLEDAHKSGELTPSEAKANRALVRQIDRGIQGANPEHVVEAANTLIEHHGALTDELVARGLLDRAQAEKAALMPFARVHMKAGYDPQKGLTDEHGNPLSAQQIVEHMEHHDIEPPGFLSHRPNTRGGGSFFRNFYPDRQRLPRQSRTGVSAARGTYDASPQALVEQAARSRSIVDATVAFDEMVKRFGKSPPNGVSSFNDAWRVLQDPEHFGIHFPPGVEFVPFRTAPFLALRRELDAAAEHQGLLDPQQQSILEQLPAKALAEAQRAGSGPVVFVPKLLLDRMEQHTQPLPTSLKAAQAVTGAFKSAILPTSPSWVFGNVLDVGIRSMLAAIGPLDVLVGRRLLKRLPEGAQESIVTGSHFSSFEHVQTYRDAKQFADSRLAPLARALGTVRRTPGPRQLVNAYLRYRDSVFAFNSKFFERLPQYGALGKEARRDMQALTGRWHHALMLGEGALEDLAKGLRDTDRQVAYAKAVEEVFGNWGKNGPEARKFLTSIAPFWMWARASTRFVLLTMPAHHPIATGLIAASAEMTEKEREQFGLDKWGPSPIVPFLQGGLPINGGVSPWAKYSSFGVFADYPGFLANVVLPQASGPLQALQGLDWKGDKLVDSEGRPVSDPDKVRVALASQLEAMAPFVGLYQSIASGGLDKAFNPTHAYPKSTVDYLRGLSNSRQITVPISGSGTAPWKEGSDLGSFSEGYAEALGGPAPWKSGGGESFTEGFMNELEGK